MFAAFRLIEECAGEHRRSVARPRRGRAPGTAMQTKLHRWAVADPGRRFDDLANLVYDPAFLVVAWNRVRGDKGARTPGSTKWHLAASVPGPGRCSTGYVMISRSVGSPPAGAGEGDPPRRRARSAARDPDDRGPGRAGRVEAGARAIFEADVKRCSYGFRPRRERRTRSPRSTTSLHPTGTTSGCSRRTSRRASTRSTTPP